MKEKKTCTMFASQAYIGSCGEERKIIANGCGPKGAKIDLVPDKIFWVNIKPACMIHDFDYYLGETNEDKESADRIFLNNMVRAINASCRFRYIRFLFKIIAYVYFTAVARFGGPAFWNNKNSGHNETEIEL